jgi:hypothetical protein
MMEQPAKESRQTQPKGITVRTSGELMELANIMHRGGLNGPGMGSPEAVAIMLGAAMELGIPLMNASNSIKVLGGKPSVYGSVGWSLLRRHPDYDTHEAIHEGDGDSRCAVIRSKRKQETKWRETRYSVADAKRAQLWNKKGPWTTNPDRMLTWRALGFHLADWWSEVLNGMNLAEAVDDFATESNVVVTAVQPNAAAGMLNPLSIMAPMTMAAIVNGPTTEQLQTIADTRRTWLIAQGINPDQDEAGVRAAWGKLLNEFGAATARALTPDQATELIARMTFAIGEADKGTPAPFGSSETGPTS